MHSSRTVVVLEDSIISGVVCIAQDFGSVLPFFGSNQELNPVGQSQTFLLYNFYSDTGSTDDLTSSRPVN